MDGATVQARVYAGYAKAAQRLGLPYDLYRPGSATAPLANKITTLQAAFDSTPNYSFKAPNEFGDPTWYALINDATTQTGDYLVGNNETYFVAGKQFLLPVIAVECNRTLRLTRMQTPTAVGAVAYSGQNTAQSADVLTGWPASVLMKGRSDKTGTNIPSSTRNAGWQILLPPSVPVVIMAGDILIDDLTRRYAVEAAELTDLGWRIQATEEHA